MAQLKPHAHVVMRKAAQRGTMVTEGDSGTMLVNRLYERKPWWLIAQALIDSSAWVLSVLFAYMLRYSVLLGVRYYSPGVVDDDRYVGCGSAPGHWSGGREDL